ncbi:MAG: DUF3108 domain-containing protein [Candidatus Nitrospinota bacterium M3_3B_026]
MITSASAADPGAEGASHPLPFSEGERLVYDISWMGIVGGEGVLEVKETIMNRGVPVYVIEVVGRSVDWLGDLYPIEDRTFSYFDIKNRRSQKVVIKISEGSYRKLKVIDFDQESHVATYKINDDPPEEFEIEPDSQDAFSVLYAFRTMRDRIRTGEAVSLPLFDDRKKYRLKINVLRKERVELPQGMVDTIVVEPELKTEGVFRRRGKMTIWFTDDENLIPVIMSSKIFIGSIYATLRDYSGTKIDFIPYPEREREKEKTGK